MRPSELALGLLCLSMCSCYAAHSVEPADGGAGPDARPPVDAMVQAPDAETDAGERVDAFCDPSLESIESASLYIEPGRGGLILVETTGMGQFYALESGRFLPRSLSPALAGRSALASAPGAPLFEYGAGRCGIRTINESTLLCSGAFASQAVFALSSSRAFAVSGSRVYEFDGDLWRQHTPALASGAGLWDVWSDGNVLLAVGSDGFYRGSAIDATPMILDADVPSRAPLELWARSGADVWLGSRGALFHLDGGIWSERWRSPCGADRRIELADVGGELVFFTEHVLGRVDLDEPKPLVARACDDSRRFESVSGGDPGRPVVVSVDPIADRPCDLVAVERLKDGTLEPF